MEGKSTPTGDMKGITPRTVEFIFQYTEALKEQHRSHSKEHTENLVNNSPLSYSITGCEVRVSIMQIYQEKLYDLLSNTNDHNSSLRIREYSGKSNGGGGVTARLSGIAATTSRNSMLASTGSTIWVEGLTEHVITSSIEFDNHMVMASKRRAVGGHKLNNESSRSHMVCILTILQNVRRRKRISTTVENSDAQGDTQSTSTTTEKVATVAERLYSKIYLVDLAGSEMVRKTAASGQRLEEAKHINKSLSALGNVIFALTPPPTEGNGSNAASSAPPHVPYRDSKLTRILQDSLGGNAKTALILTISASKAHMFETLATLRFGERARQLKTKPRINSESGEASIKKALLLAKEKIRSLTLTISTMEFEMEELRAVNSRLTNGVGSEKQKEISGNNSICSVCQRVLDKDKTKEREKPPLIEKKKVASAAASKPKTPGQPQEKPPVAKKKSSAPTLAKTREQSPSPAQPSASPSPTPFVVESVSEPDVEPVPAPIAEPIVTTVVDPVVEVETPSPEPEEAAEEDLDPSSRCAVCGLDPEESDHLVRDTGEYLGEMFACDGNCGCMYHVKCAGVIGEGGQFSLPDGEWFCTLCTANMCDDNNDADANSTVTNILLDKYSNANSSYNRLKKYRKKKTKVSISNSNNNSTSNSNVESEEETGDEDGILGYTSDFADLNSLSISVDGDGEDLSINDSLIYTNDELPQNFNDIEGGSVTKIQQQQHDFIQKTVSDYHIMRRERNRILTQWQHEKKISQLLDQNRQAVNKQKDKEYLQMKLELDSAVDAAAELEVSKANVEAQNAELWKLLTELTAATGVGAGSNLGESNGPTVVALNEGEKPSIQQQELIRKIVENALLNSGKKGRKPVESVDIDTPPTGSPNISFTKPNNSTSLWFKKTLQLDTPDKITKETSRNSNNSEFESSSRENRSASLEGSEVCIEDDGVMTATEKRRRKRAEAAATVASASSVVMPKLVRLSSNSCNNLNNLGDDALDHTIDASAHSNTHSTAFVVPENGIPKPWKGRSGTVSSSANMNSNQVIPNTSLKSMISSVASSGGMHDTGRRLLSSSLPISNSSSGKSDTITDSKNDNIKSENSSDLSTFTKTHTLSSATNAAKDTNNRINELLSSVKQELGSCVEIREKYKPRDLRRNS